MRHQNEETDSNNKSAFDDDDQKGKDGTKNQESHDKSPFKSDGQPDFSSNSPLGINESSIFATPVSLHDITQPRKILTTSNTQSDGEDKRANLEIENKKKTDTDSNSNSIEFPNFIEGDGFGTEFTEQVPANFGTNPDSFPVVDQSMSKIDNHDSTKKNPEETELTEEDLEKYAKNLAKKKNKCCINCRIKR